ARFQREARSAARLHHTNIVPVFEVGHDGDTFYYAMQLILGQGLDEVIDELCRLRANSAAGRPHPDSEGSGGAADGKASASPPAADLAQSLRSGQFRPPPDDAVPEPDRPDGSGVRASTSASAVLPGRHEFSSVQADYTQYFRGVARIGKQAAEAVAYAHARGVI